MTSNTQIILTLTKKHIIARSHYLNQPDKIFTADITFDLKFETIYLTDKNVLSKKIGIKFLLSNT